MMKIARTGDSRDNRMRRMSSEGAFGKELAAKKVQMILHREKEGLLVEVSKRSRSVSAGSGPKALVLRDLEKIDV